jgi:hypothetical protein
MSTATDLRPIEAALVNERVYRFTVDQYHNMIDKGVLNSDSPVELVEGILVYKMSKNTPHATSVRKCRRAIQPALPATFFYDAEQPITLTTGEPEPDGMIVRGKIEDFESAHPTPADVVLVIEVADVTLDRDRGIKLQGYARAGIACYWILNLVDRQLEVHTDPDPVTARYRRREVFHPSDTVSIVIDGATIARIIVSNLLPSAAT